MQFFIMTQGHLTLVLWNWQKQLPKILSNLIAWWLIEKVTLSNKFRALKLSYLNEA